MFRYLERTRLIEKVSTSITEHRHVTERIEKFSKAGGVSFFIIVPEKIRYFEKENQGNSMSSDQRTRVTPVVSNQGLAP